MKWATAELGDIADIVSGATPKSGKKEYWGGDIQWATPTDLSGLKTKEIATTERTITEEGFASCSTSILPARSVLFSSRAPIGLVAINTLPICTNQGFKSFVPRRDLLSPDFLFWWLKTHRSGIERLGRGATFKEVSKSIVAQIKIPLPPLAEQKRIAAILDAADALRAKRRESLAQLDALVQSTFLEMFGDPVTNPKGWKRKKLGEMINFVGGSQPPKDTFTYEPGEGKIRLVQIRDFKSGKYATYIPKNLSKRRFDVDDVMIARYGPPVFQILRGLSGSYNVALMKAEPIGKIEKLFIFYLLDHPYVNAAVVAQSQRTAGQTGVNLKFLNDFPAYLPDINLQRRFAAIVESIEHQKSLQRTHLAELDALFVSLQHRAFSGELSFDDVSDVQTTISPSDPPTSISRESKPEPQPISPSIEANVPPARSTQKTERKPAPIKEAPTASAPHPIEDYSTEEVMAAVRQVMRSKSNLSRDEVIYQLALSYGYSRVGPKTRKILSGHLLAAQRRNILSSDGLFLYLERAGIRDYTRDELVQVIVSVTHMGCLYTREELVYAVSEYLGFSRVMDSTREEMKSALNAAVRRGIIERIDSETIKRIG